MGYEAVGVKKVLAWVLVLALVAWISEALAVTYILLSALFLPIAWLVRHSSVGNAGTSDTSTGVPASGVTHRASAPKGSPVEAWAVTGTVRLNVVGESRYPEGFRAALQDFRLPFTAQGVELPDVRAAVVTDPTNPYDSNAVSVWIEGRHLVGYLPADLAEQYAPALSQLESEGSHLRVPARVWVAERDGVFGSVSLVMPPPEGVVSFNEFPEAPLQVLPPGRALQVTGEDKHMDVLTRYLCDRPRYLALTLHEVIDEPKTPRSQPASVVEVRLDGNRVGCLSKAMSEQVRDVVAYVNRRGHVPVARGVLKGSSIKADITLYVARSSEVSQAWLDRIPSLA